MLSSITLRSPTLLRLTRSASTQATRALAQSFYGRGLLRTTLGSTTTVIPRTVNATWSRSLYGDSNTSSGPSRNQPSNQVFIGNLPWSTTKEEITELFGEYGEIEEIKLHTHGDGRPRGSGHVYFKTLEAATACFNAAAEETIYFGGRDLVIDYASGSVREIVPQNRLFFKGFTEGEEKLRQLLTDFSDQLVSVYFIKDGYEGARLPDGFIEFRTVEDAADALNALKAYEEETEGFLVRYAFAPTRRAKPNNSGARRSQDRQGGSRRENAGGYAGRGVSRRSREEDDY